MTPTGSSSEQVGAYYDWLYQHYLSNIPLDRATEILWSSPIAIFVWAFVLIVFFYLYARHLQNAHRKKGELYGAASFAGSILERIGPVSLFTWIVSIAVTLWALYFVVVQTLRGQIY